MNPLRRSLATALLAPALAFGALATVPACSGADTNYGQVAMYVATMLQKTHYLRKDIDDEISDRLLTTYLDFLDFKHQYFTQEDIDRFDKLYRTSLDDQILVGDIGAASDIYETFVTRAKDRVEKIRNILETETFTFDGEGNVEISREDAPWPKDMAAADKLWRDIIKGEVLQEHLRLAVGDDAAETDPGARLDELHEEVEETEDEVGATPQNIDQVDSNAPGDTDPDAVVSETPAEEETPEAKVLKRYDRLLENLAENEEEDVVNFFLTALSASYDPHSDWFSQSELDNFTISMSNSLVGIGALLEMKEGAAEISGLVVGGPAQRAGELKVGDRIVGVAQGQDAPLEDVMFMKLSKIVEKIRGTQGSVVRLQVNPADADDPSVTTEIAIVRDEVQLKDKLATAQLIDTEIEPGKPARLGWIELPSFYADMEDRSAEASSTTRDVQRLLERLVAENISGLILDLRGNGGGSLEEAINLTGLFIPKGPVVQSKDWRDEIDFRSSKNRYPLYEGPMIVLVDKASASASEILAAALQDYNRALVVGEKSTFGKGTVQTILKVGDHMPFFSEKKRAGALKVTIQKFYRIDGTTTQLRGVVPDLQLPSRRDALEIGEESLDYPLVHDTIPPQKYTFSNPTVPLTEEIVARHTNRLEENPEFQYILEDTARLKDQIERNTVSLNEAKRLEEVERNKVRNKRREAEREARVAEIAENEPDRFKVFRLTLSNVDAEELVPASEFSDSDSSGMILAEDDEKAAPNSEFPYAMDPVKLESLHVLHDMITLGKSSPATARVAE
ncbi:carboxy terminal-processing peptidase [soil metagenome]